MRGQVTGTQPGRLGRGLVRGRRHAAVKSDSFTYTAKVESGRRVLVVAAEDYTGHLAGLQEDRRADVPVVLPRRARGERHPGRRLRRRRQRPQGARARSACSATTTPSSGTRATTSSRASRAWSRARRRASRTTRCSPCAQYLERGRPAALHGQVRRACSTPQGYEFDPETNAAVQSGLDARTAAWPLSDDFLQYYLGAYIYNDDAGHDPEREALRRPRRRRRRSAASRWSFGGAEREQPGPQRLVHRDERHPARADVPAVRRAGRRRKYDRPGGPFDPHTGTYYVYSQIADVSYKRLTRTIDLTGSATGTSRSGSRTTPRPTGTSCSSRPTPSARTTGRRCPTRTATRRARPDGRQLPGGLARAPSVPRALPDAQRRRHVLADRHDRRVERGVRATRAAGSSGRSTSPPTRASRSRSRSPTRATGRSRGSASFVDDIDGLDRRDDVLRGRTRRLGGHRSAAGQRAEREQLSRTTAAGFPEGAAITTPDSIYFGFGFEGIATPAARNAVMGRAMGYLLR